MAIFYVRASIIKSSQGKSAVASAAYQSAQSLYNERLGQTFTYPHKEEVLHSEIMLPANAPEAFGDRGTLWNAVEAKEDRANSRYARQFVIAIPKEWTEEEAIVYTRAFLQEAFVDKGMAVDWAFHNKENNPHVHAMCTVRGFTKDGNWAQMEKKDYALDAQGNRIPEIDPKTGEQKVRVRTRNGNTSTEKIWKRVTVQANNWNKRQFVTDTKKLWEAHCNRHLSQEKQISSLSYEDQGINRVPMVHEGVEARAALEKGIVFDCIQENRERQEINRTLERLEKFVQEARKILEQLKERLLRRRENEEKRSRRANPPDGGNRAAIGGLPRPDERAAARDRETAAKLKEYAENLTKKVRRHKHRH